MAGSDTYTLADLMRPRDQDVPTLGGRPTLPGISIGTEPPLAQHNLIDRALRSFGQPSLEAVQSMQRGETSPDAVAHEFMLHGPMGPLAMFAGRLARTADLPALHRAQEMAAAGRTRDDIWNQTGWFQGRDGHWRFEIDDSGARLTNAATAAAEYTGRRPRIGEPLGPDAPPGLSHELSRPAYHGPMREGMHHPNLYEAYPSFRDAPLVVTRTDDISGTHAAMRGGRDQFAAHAPDDPTRRSVTLHEVQHGIQHQEGFEYTHPWGPATSRLYGELVQEGQRADDAARSFWDRLFGRRRPGIAGVTERQHEISQQIERTAADEYRRQIAEVEARNVQARANLTAAERRARPPWLTEDVPADQQLWWRSHPLNQ